MVGRVPALQAELFFPLPRILGEVSAAKKVHLLGTRALIFVLPVATPREVDKVVPALLPPQLGPLVALMALCQT